MDSLEEEGAYFVSFQIPNTSLQNSRQLLSLQRTGCNSCSTMGRCCAFKQLHLVERNNVAVMGCTKALIKQTAEPKAFEAGLLGLPTNCIVLVVHINNLNNTTQTRIFRAHLFGQNYHGLLRFKQTIPGPHLSGT